MIAMFGVVVSLAVAPPGFTEAKQLEPAASYVAGKPATVYCADSDAAWAAFLAATGREGQTANGSAVPGSSEAKFSPAVCHSLAMQAANLKPPLTSLAPSILVITHEAIHLRGETNEGVTDCAAVHEMPRVAVKFFGIKAGRQLRAVMAAAWAYRGKEAAVYRSVC